MTAPTSATLLLATPAGGEGRLAGLLRAGELPGVAASWEVTAAALPKHDPDGRLLPTLTSPHAAVVDLVARGGDAGRADDAHGVLDALGSAVDRSACAVVVGPRYDLSGGGFGTGDGGRPGGGGRWRTGSQACITRLAGLPPESFAAHWLTRHAPLAARIGGATAYGQLHADGAATAGLSVALGLGGVRFDGIGRLLFADRAAMLRARASQQVRRDATADEMRFVDHSRSQVTALHRIVPADAHSAAAAPTRSHAHT